MSKIKLLGKLLISILIIVFIIYASSIIYKRYFSKKEIQNIENTNDDKNELEKLKNRPPLNTEINIPENNNESQKIEENQRESLFKISQLDCQNECKNYNQEQEKFDYCKQICGFIPIPISTDEKTESNECEKLFNLEKDYCWRNQAVKESNYEKCEKIIDKNIFQQCKNRITEDIYDR